MRVLVCGGRDYRKFGFLTETLDRLNREHAITAIIVGGAPGADAFAEAWGDFWNKEVVVFPPDWAAQGRAAGPLRNARMIAEGKPDLVVAFPGGAGTADCVRKARAAGIKVVEVSR